MEHAPRVVPAVALGEGVTPLERAEGCLKGAVGEAATHEARLAIKHVAVVHGAFPIHLYLALRLAQSLSQTVDTPVVVGILQRPGHALVDADTVGDIPQLIVLFISQAAGGFHLWMDGNGAMHDGFPQLVDVIAAQALQVAIGDNRRAVVAHHAIAVPRACPLGQETALEISVHQPFLHLGTHRRVHQIHQREQCPEGVPKTGVGEHASRLHLTIIWAVVHVIAVPGNLIEGAREQHRAVQARVERAQVVNIAVRGTDAAQHLVPALPPLFLDDIEVVVSQFLEVEQGLVNADKRRRDAGRHLLATTGGKPHDGARMVTGGALHALMQHAVLHGVERGEGLIKRDNEPILEAVGHSAAVA